MIQSNEERECLLISFALDLVIFSTRQKRIFIRIHLVAERVTQMESMEVCSSYRRSNSIALNVSVYDFSMIFQSLKNI